MVHRLANLTVAIATLNRPDALARCLDALLSADVLPAEVVVVDQSHDDRTKWVVERHRGGDSALIYIRQRRRGLSASRNAGIARAGCPVICMTDDDCVPDPGWVATIEQHFTSPQVPAVMTGRVLPLGVATPGLYVVSAREGTKRIDFRGAIAPWLVGSGGNFALRLECLARIGLYDERLGAGSPGKAAEDMDFIYRILRAGGRIRYVPEATIYHERQSVQKRLSARATYGFGMGAFFGKWLRHRDRYALHLLHEWLAWQSWDLVLSARNRHWFHAYEQWLSVQGTARGLLYGLRLPATPREGER